jgi:hypothetical protein
MKLAVRWAGACEPYQPSQGRKQDGCIDGAECIDKILRGNRKRVKRKRRRQLLTQAANPSSLVMFAKRLRRRPLKPYAIFVAIPVYLMLWLILKRLMPYVPGVERVAPVMVQARTKVLSLVMPKLIVFQQWLSSRMRQEASKYIAI